MLLLFFCNLSNFFSLLYTYAIYSSLKNELDANNIFAHTRTTEYKASIYPCRGQIQRKFLIYMILCKSKKKKKGLCTRILSYIGRNMVQHIYVCICEVNIQNHMHIWKLDKRVSDKKQIKHICTAMDICFVDC